MLWFCALSLPLVSRLIPRPCFQSQWILLPCMPRALGRTLMHHPLTILRHDVMMVLTSKPWSPWAQFLYDPNPFSTPPHTPCTIHELEEESEYTTIYHALKHEITTGFVFTPDLLVRLNTSCLVSRLTATSPPSKFARS